MPNDHKWVILWFSVIFDEAEPVIPFSSKIVVLAAQNGRLALMSDRLNSVQPCIIKIGGEPILSYH